MDDEQINNDLLNALAVFEPNDSDADAIRERSRRKRILGMPEVANIRGSAYSNFATMLINAARTDAELAHRIRQTIPKSIVDLDVPRKRVRELVVALQEDKCTASDFVDGLRGVMGALKGWTRNNAQDQAGVGFASAIMLEVARSFVLMHNTDHPVCNTDAWFLKEIFDTLLTLSPIGILRNMEEEMRKFEDSLERANPPVDRQDGDTISRMISTALAGGGQR